MAEYTLTYDEQIKGWVSFYSYIPEKMIGMNQFLYSFKNGNLYKHNSNETRNNFYGVQYNSKITSVINKTPLSNKVFKAFYLESDDVWDSTFTTDKITGFINKEYYEKKESDFFAFIRTDLSPVDEANANYDSMPFLQLRSVNGIAQLTGSNVVSATEWQIIFADGIVFNSYVNEGDYLYNFNGVPQPTAIGRITSITQQATAPFITVDPSVISPTPPLIPPLNGSLIINVKDSTAESNGLLGHYIEFTLENTNTAAVELFAVGADVMNSEPNPQTGGAPLSTAQRAIRKQG